MRQLTQFHGSGFRRLTPGCCRGYRLTTNHIEPISFTVPRVKSTFFQDDLFPPTRVNIDFIQSGFIIYCVQVLWRAACSGGGWLEGELGAAEWVSLRPLDMPALSNGEGVLLAPGWCSWCWWEELVAKWNLRDVGQARGHQDPAISCQNLQAQQVRGCCGC